MCYRDDGSPTNEIALPTQEPFVLVRYSTTCQSVMGMIVTDVYVRWDDDDVFSGSDYGGMHPADEEGGEDHLLHFCHYASPTDAIIG